MKPSRAILILRVLFAIVFAVVLDYWVYPYHASMPGQPSPASQNGLWLKYTWYFGDYGQADLDSLPKRLHDNKIVYAYFHVRSIKRDGTLRYRYPDQAKALTSTLHRTAPGVKLIAWVYAGNPDGLGKVNLKKADVRRRMVEEAVWLTTDCGFDGVQWDYEICRSGDPGLIDLLSETSAALPSDKIVSVCTPIWVPNGFYGWTDEYFTAVARHCDQMTVMAYDTAAYFPRTYVDVMCEQVIHVSTAVASSNPNCRVLIGIPTYDDGTRSHNPTPRTSTLPSVVCARVWRTRRQPARSSTGSPSSPTTPPTVASGMTIVEIGSDAEGQLARTLHDQENVVKASWRNLH